MKYEFYIHTNKTYGWQYYRVNFEDKKFDIISQILSLDDWSETKIQEIIDGLEHSKTLPKGEEYTWANEDVIFYANENGILLVDQMAQRAGELDPDNITLRLTHDELITFFQYFKKFVEENSLDS